MRLTILGLLLLGLAACNEKEPETDNEVTMQSLAGRYTITKIEAGTGSALLIDVTNTVLGEACMKDNYLELEAAGTAHYVDAGQKCVPPADDHGSWQLTGQTVEMEVANLPLANNQATLTSYDGKTLVVTGTGTSAIGGAQVRITFSKQ